MLNEDQTHKPSPRARVAASGHYNMYSTRTNASKGDHNCTTRLTTEFTARSPLALASYG